MRTRIKHQHWGLLNTGGCEWESNKGKPPSLSLSGPSNESWIETGCPQLQTRALQPCGSCDVWRVAVNGPALPGGAAFPHALRHRPATRVTNVTRDRIPTRRAPARPSSCPALCTGPCRRAAAATLAQAGGRPRGPQGPSLQRPCAPFPTPPTPTRAPSGTETKLQGRSRGCLAHHIPKLPAASQAAPRSTRTLTSPRRQPTRF